MRLFLLSGLKLSPSVHRLELAPEIGQSAGQLPVLAVQEPCSGRGDFLNCPVEQSLDQGGELLDRVTQVEFAGGASPG